MAASLLPANSTQRRNGLAATSSVSSTSSDDSQVPEVASSSSKSTNTRMGVIHSRLKSSSATSKGKRATRDEDGEDEKEAEPGSSSGGSQNIKVTDPDVMASPTKKRRIEKSHRQPSIASSLVDAHRQSRSPIRDSDSGKLFSPRAEVAVATNELAHLSIPTPTKSASTAKADSPSSASPVRMHPVVEVPPPHGQGRSRDASRDVDMQDVNALNASGAADDTLDNIGQGDSVTGRVKTSSGREIETATQRSKAGSGKPNRPFAPSSTSFPKDPPKQRAAISHSDSSLSPTSSPVPGREDRRSLSPPKDITTSRGRTKKNRTQASKAVKEKEKETVKMSKKPKKGKKEKPPSQAEILASQGCDEETIAELLGPGRPARRASAVTKKSYVEEKSDSNSEAGEQEEEGEDSPDSEEKSEPEEMDIEKDEDTDYSEPEIQKPSKRAKGKGRANEPERAQEITEVPKTKPKGGKAKGAGTLRKTASESNAAKPKKKVDTGKKRSVSSKELSKQAQSTEDETTKAVLSVSDDSSVVVSASKANKTRKAAGPRKAKPVNGKARPSISSEAPRASASTTRKRSLSVSSGSPLPSGFPLSSQQSRPAWDFDMLENELFITVPAKKKAETAMMEQDVESAENEDSPMFWWPAKIVSRNRQNFRVKLVLDGKKEILAISPQELTIPPYRINEDNLINFSDSFFEVPAFPDAKSATSSFRSHASIEEYTIPSDSAFESVISIAIRQQNKNSDDDALPEINGATFNSPARKTPTKRKNGKAATSKAKNKGKGKIKTGSGSAESGDMDEDDDDPEVNGILGAFGMGAGGGRRIDVEDDESADELEAGIDVGDVCIGEDAKSKLWWPARIIRLWPEGPPRRPNGKGRQNAKQGPYEVEFYPNGTAFLRRKQIKLSDDAGFHKVEWGEVEADKDDKAEIKKEELEATLPDLVKLIQEEYPAGQHRQALFFGSHIDRTKRLPDTIHYGLFSLIDREFIITYLTDWINGKLQVACQPPSNARLDGLEGSKKPEYVMNVLAPTALEILVINDTDDIRETARRQLEQEGVEVSPGKIRERDHLLAIKGLKEAVAEEWYRRMYTLRDMHLSMKNLNRKMKVSEEDLYGDSGAGRRGRKVNYAEK